MPSAVVSGMMKTLEAEPKGSLKLEKAIKSGEWDMFADQDYLDSLDVRFFKYIIG